jgi:hypothetical protein
VSYVATVDGDYSNFEQADGGARPHVGLDGGNSRCATINGDSK